MLSVDFDRSGSISPQQLSSHPHAVPFLTVRRASPDTVCNAPCPRHTTATPPQVATVLLALAFSYDIFWVFVSPQLFGESVMVKVATGGDITEDPTFCEKYPDQSGCKVCRACFPRGNVCGFCHVRRLDLRCPRDRGHGLVVCLLDVYLVGYFLEYLVFLQSTFFCPPERLFCPLLDSFPRFLISLVGIQGSSLVFVDDVPLLDMVIVMSMLSMWFAFR